MNGPLAAMLHTLRAYAETGTCPLVTLKYAFVSDEETAGPAGMPALLERGLLDADACVIGEPTCEAGRHSVTIADKRSIWLTLEAEETAVHGSRPQLGENAIDRLFDAVEDICDWLTRQSFAIDDALVSTVAESVSFYRRSRPSIPGLTLRRFTAVGRSPSTRTEFQSDRYERGEWTTQEHGDEQSDRDGLDEATQRWERVDPDQVSNDTQQRGNDTPREKSSLSGGKVNPSACRLWDEQSNREQHEATECVYTEKEDGEAASEPLFEKDRHGEHPDEAKCGDCPANSCEDDL